MNLREFRMQSRFELMSHNFSLKRLFKNSSNFLMHFSSYNDSLFSFKLLTENIGDNENIESTLA